MIKECRLLQVLDQFLCLFVFFPSMVFYWRGIWDLYGVYIFPGDQPRSAWAITGLGGCAIVGYFALPLLKFLLLSFFSPVNRIVYVVVTRVYMYLFAVLSMAYWRGVWNVADYYLLQFGWVSCVAGLAVCHFLLLIFRCSRSAIFPPFVVCLDTRKDLLVASTCFQTKVDFGEPWSVIKYTMDSIFTQYVVVTTTILCWRSSISLIDLFLYPDDAFTSNVSCFAIGFIGSIILFAFENIFSRISDGLVKRCSSSSGGRSSRWTRLVFEDVVYLLVFTTETFLWRGAWNLNSQFIFPDPLVGGWVNHLIGTFLLMTLQLFSYVGGCGCCRDCEQEDVAITSSSTEFTFNTKYLRVAQQYIHNRKQKQLSQMDVNVEIADDANTEEEEKQKQMVATEEMMNISCESFPSPASRTTALMSSTSFSINL